MKAQQVVENVESIYKQKVDFAFKIIVIDNSCHEVNASYLRELKTRRPEIHLEINKTNLGYTKAHNSIKHLIEGEYIFIINPDIFLMGENVLQKMLEYMDANPQVGISGPKQINETGGVTMSIRAFPKFYLQVARRTFFRHLPIIKSLVSYDEMQHLNYDKIQDVDWLQSSFVVIRHELWKKIRGFNERYFMFMSDVEICFEAWRLGYRVVYYPEVFVHADGKRASAGGFKKFFQSWVLRQHVVDSMKYRWKHFFHKNPRLKIKK